MTLATSAALTLSASAAITVTNGTFEDPANPNNNSGNAAQNVSGWFDTSATWSSWHFSVGSGGSGKGNEVLVMRADGWVYQSLGTLDLGNTALDWQIDVHSTNGGPYAFQIEFFAGDFASAAENVDILGHANQPTTLGGATTFGVNALGTFNGSVDVSGEPAGTKTWVRLNQSSGDFERLDNLQVVAVPEPSSVALLGLGGLALLFRRRK